MTEQLSPADPVAAAIGAAVGADLDPGTVERVARLARYLLAADPALGMRLGSFQIDASRAAVKAAVTAAVLALAIEGAGLDSVPVVILAAVIPFLVEIERVQLAPGDAVVVAALRSVASPGGDDRDWYLALPGELRSQLTQLEFLNLLGRLREAGIVTTNTAGDNQLASGSGRLRLRIPWR
jgi:hypothetical protein